VLQSLARVTEGMSWRFVARMLFIRPTAPLVARPKVVHAAKCGAAPTAPQFPATLVSSWRFGAGAGRGFVLPGVSTVGWKSGIGRAEEPLLRTSMFQ